MAAKLVEAVGSPWSSLEEEFHDPDVAVDFLSTLDPRLGPTVVKAGDPTGKEPSKERLVGWWLCESGRPGRLMRNVRKLYVSSNLRAPVSVGYRGPLDEWRDARDAAAAVAWASAVGVPRRKVAAAALDASIDAMKLSAGWRSPNRSIEDAIRRASSVLSDLLSGKDVAGEASHRRDGILVSVIVDDRLTNGEANAMRAAAEGLSAVMVADAWEPMERTLRRCMSLANASSHGHAIDFLRKHVSVMDFLRACALPVAGSE